MTLRSEIRQLRKDLGGADPDPCPVCHGDGPESATIYADTDEQVAARAPRCPACGVTGDLLVIARHIPGQPPPTGTVVRVLGRGISMADL